MDTLLDNRCAGGSGSHAHTGYNKEGENYADVEAYLCMVDLIVEKAQEISSARHQKSLVRSFVNAAAVSTIDTMYAMGYSFGGARLEMELDSGGMPMSS